MPVLKGGASMYERMDLIIMGFSKLKMNIQSNPFITIQFGQGVELGMVSVDGY